MKINHNSNKSNSMTLELKNSGSYLKAISKLALYSIFMAAGYTLVSFIIELKLI